MKIAVLTGGGGPHTIRRQPHGLRQDPGRTPRRRGAAAVEALSDGDAGKMMGLKEDRIGRVPMEEVVGEDRPLDPGLYELVGALARIPR